MIKKYILLFLLMLPVVSYAQSSIIDTIKYVSSEKNLITNTSSVNTYRYRTFTYNSVGLCLSENYWIKGNSYPTVAYYYDYDSKGNLLRLSTNFFNEGIMEETGATEYAYYDDDLLKSMVKYTYGRYNRKEISDSAYYQYDESQRLCLEYKLWPYNETYEYSYDEKGNLVRVSTYNQEKVITRIERRKYDEDGHILYKQGTNQTSKDSVDYTYDDNGLLKQEVQYGWNDGSYIFSWRHYYYYDNRNFMIKEHVDQYYKSYGKFFGYYEQEYEYDETGNMICRHYKGLKDGNIVNNGTKFCNEYDKNGNTIKIFSKIYDGDTWRDNSLSEDTEFTYNHGLCKYVCNVNTDITWPDSILISYRDKDEIASSVIQNSTASIRYTLHGNYIRFNITAEDFKYMSVSNLAGQCVYYTRPSAKLSKGINIICIKTNKGKYTYKLLL